MSVATVATASPLPLASVPVPTVGTEPQRGRFHLLVGEDDWKTCLEPDRTVPVLVDDSSQGPSSFEWDRGSGSLRLAHREAVGRQVTTSSTLRTPEERRGADRDRHGTWYRISDDRRSIIRLVPGHDAATSWWSLDHLRTTCTPSTGSFSSVPEPAVADDARLAGLAITTGHRLVVGLDDQQGGGLIHFDLHSRGVPLVLRWPGSRAVTPFDLSATGDGGVLVLDRTRRMWWRLDRAFRLTAAVTPPPEAVFVPANGSAPTSKLEPTVEPQRHLLDANETNAVFDPVAIAEGPGVVLILDRPEAGPSAVVVCHASGEGPATVVARLVTQVDALDPTRPDQPRFLHDVVGQDLAWGPAGSTTPLLGPLVYVADASTSGTEAYRLDLDAVPPRLVHLSDELPMRSWGAAALVAAGGDVFYDTVGRWVPLEPFGVCNVERAGVLRTATGFGPREGTGLTGDDDPVPGQPFDSATPGCVWHRLFLDAEIPDGCAITVGARATDDPALLDRLPFVTQPTPYLHGGGSELPWHDPWATTERRPVSPRSGSWELLFQGVIGRYLQLEMTLTGTGRTTPSLRALRAWYPRFSYVHAYLPEAYQEEDEPGRFLERLLANMEGLLTEHEARIDDAWVLAEPRTAPTEALDWLASWLGLHLEPAWNVDRRRFLLRHVDRLYRIRGTLGGLRALLRLYLGCSLDPDVVFAPLTRTDDPARIVELVGAHRFKVLVPTRLDDDRALMVARIVAAARPAHTAFEVRSSSGLLVVGEAQVGLDTVVGESLGFIDLVLGQVALGAGVLAAAHPFDIADRVVSDRDRLGELPPL